MQPLAISHWPLALSFDFSALLVCKELLHELINRGMYDFPQNPAPDIC